MQKASPNRLSSQSNNRYKRYIHHIHNHSSEEDSASLIEKPMQDLPQNAQEAQGREAWPWFRFRLFETAATYGGVLFDHS